MFFRPAFVIAAAVQPIYECIARVSTIVKVVCNHTKQDVASEFPPSDARLSAQPFQSSPNHIGIWLGASLNLHSRA